MAFHLIGARASTDVPGACSGGSRHPSPGVRDRRTGSPACGDPEPGRRAWANDELADAADIRDASRGLGAAPDDLARNHGRNLEAVVQDDSGLHSGPVRSSRSLAENPQALGCAEPILEDRSGPLPGGRRLVERLRGFVSTVSSALEKGCRYTVLQFAGPIQNRGPANSGKPREYWLHAACITAGLLLHGVPEAHAQVQTAAASVCDRTGQVRDAIVDAISGVSGCQEVSDEALAEIRALSMFAADIGTLKADDFDGLADLRTLSLGYNRLRTLPPGIFDGLASLETLWLNGNQLLMLPAGVFSGLSSMTDLRLADNIGYPFGPVAHAGPTQTHAADSAVTLFGSGGSDPWGREVAFRWTQTDTSGLAVAIDGADTPTPTFTGPALETETVLAFTLEVTAVNPVGGAPPGTSPEGDTARDTAHIWMLAAEPVTVSFFARSYTATEGGSTATVVVRLDRIPRRTVEIPLMATPGNGADAGDYSVPAHVTFGFVDWQKTISIVASDDETDDDGESVELGFGSPLPAAVTVGSVSTATVSLEDNDLPEGVSIVDVAIVSDPGSDAVYGVGDTIQAAVTFEDAVVVAGSPRLQLDVGAPVMVLLGRAARFARYRSGSGTRELVFAYTVAQGDSDFDGVSIAADSLSLNQGSITDGGGSVAVLHHPAVAPQPGHRVDAVAPEVSDVFVDGVVLTIRYTEALDESAVPTVDQFEVLVDGLPRAVSGVGVEGKFVTLTLASGVQPGERVRAAYTVPETHAIRDLAGLPASAFANRAATNTTLPTVSITVVDPEVYEGIDLDFTLTRNGPATGTLNARVRIEDRGDVLDERNGYRQVQFAAGETTAWLTISTRRDLDYEPHTVVIATVEGTGRYDVSPTMGSASATVLDNDVPEIDVAWDGPRSVDEASGGITVRIRATTVEDAEPHGHMTVRLSSTDRTAHSRADGDFTAIDEAVQFRLEQFDRVDGNGGQRYVAVVERLVVIHDDTLQEGNEAFALNLRLQGGLPRPINLPEAPLVVTILDNEMPGIPANVEVVANDAALRVSWSAAVSATGYRVQWKSGSIETFETAAADGRERFLSGGSNTFESIGGLTNGTEYTVRLIAVSAAGDGPASEEVKGTPRAAPARVSGVTVAAGDGELAVSWNAVSGATGYRVQWRSSAARTLDAADGREHLVAGGSSTSYTIRNLVNEVEHMVRVIATNAGVDGPASQEVAATPAYVPPEAPPGTTLVSNAGRNADNSYSLASVAAGRYAQGFTTGPHGPGYILDSIGISVLEAALSPGAIWTAYLHAVNGDGGLGSLLYTLKTPTRFGRNAVHLFTAPPGASLEADTRYLVTFAGTSTNARDFRVNATRANAVDAGNAEGWSIDNALLFDGSPHGNGDAFMFAVHGRPYVSNDTALGELTLLAGGTPVVLDEEFDPERTAYKALVRHSVAMVTVSARARNGNTAVVLPVDEDPGETGTQVRLDVGDNLIVLDVVAEDGSTRRYSVTVMRQALPVIASVTDLPAEHGGPGMPFRFELQFSRRIAVSYKTLRDHAFSISGGRVVCAKRLDASRRWLNGERRTMSDRWRISVEPDGEGPVALSLPADRPCTETGAICAADGGRVSNGLELAVPGPGGGQGLVPLTISVADATGDEDEGVILFPITLSRPLGSHRVAVDIETAGGTARPDVDYVSVAETIVFDPGRTRIDLNIALRDDDVDDSGESFFLRLSNARIVDPERPGFLVGNPIPIVDNEAEGTIINPDPMPREWLARFGRTAAEHVVDGVLERLEAPRAPGFRGRVVGAVLGASEEQAAGGRQLHMTGGGREAAVRGEPGICHYHTVDTGCVVWHT